MCYSSFILLFKSQFGLPGGKVLLQAIGDSLRGQGGMENGETRSKSMKVLEIPFSSSSSSETEMSLSSSLNHSAAAGAGGGLTRQGSLAKNNCLCSPTTHAGSFRCRFHRAPVNLQRTKSIDSSSSSLSSPVKDDSPDSNSKPTASTESTVV